MCAHQACMYRRLTPSSLQVISTEGAAPDRTAHSQESVAKLRAQLTELQQAEAALGQQVGWRLRGPPAGTGLTRGGKQRSVWPDVWWTPTLQRCWSDGLPNLSYGRKWGTYHLSCSRQCYSADMDAAWHGDSGQLALMALH